MRRIAAALLVPLAACAVLAGCGSSGPLGLSWLGWLSDEHQRRREGNRQF